MTGPRGWIYTTSRDMTRCAHFALTGAIRSRRPMAGVSLCYRLLEAATCQARQGGCIPETPLAEASASLEVSVMLSDHPDRFLVSVPVSATLPMQHGVLVLQNESLSPLQESPPELESFAAILAADPAQP